MSGAYWLLLWKRAERFLARAMRDYEERDYDGACFNSEQAVQLAIKATLYRIFGERLRIHSSKTLLSYLRNLLYQGNREDLARIVDDLVSMYRRELELLEESYIEGRYGEFEYLEKQGRVCIDTAKKMLEVLRDIEGRLA